MKLSRDSGTGRCSTEAGKINMIKKLALLVALLTQSVSFSNAQRQFEARPTGSGGVLSAEQAAYDVRHYDLSVRLDIENRLIIGQLVATALILAPISEFVLDLDGALSVSSAKLTDATGVTDLRFRHEGGKLRIALPTVQAKGNTIKVAVGYAGKPRVAPNPPWVGGFVWSKTPSGEPWIATAVQNDGSDLWFPVKDHPSDKPETTSLRFTVPDPLVAASNGRLVSVRRNQDGTSTYNWFVSQPISNYNIALNVAPYSIIKDEVRSVTGEMIPIEFYVTPENFDKAPKLVEETKKYLAFFEKYLGPYSFRKDKLGIAETPHLGMEHQSIIAYGNQFRLEPDGFDWLMFHELGHEWWANLVTARDWNDFWIHEGFQSFMDTFYFETTRGRAVYLDAMKRRRAGLRNVKPVAPREPKTTTEMYLLPPDYVRSDGDIYGKGALILHTLRFYIGDDAFFRALRRMSYPDPMKEKTTDGSQNRLTTTDEFLAIAERESGKKLDWFFEQYLRSPSLPALTAERRGDTVTLKWEAPAVKTFPMPVEVRISGKTIRVDVSGPTEVKVPEGAEFAIDPDGWVLRAR